MPHKRAKRSLREQHRAQTGADLPPARTSYADEALPKSVARVLNAAQVRAEWRARKLKRGLDDGGEESGDSGRKKRRKGDEEKSKGVEKGKTIGIQPGESLAHFNKRVENNMAPLIRTAMQTSSAHARKARKATSSQNNKDKHTSKDSDSESDEAAPPAPALVKQKTRATEFDTAAPRRLNDIAQAPPEFRRLPRGASTSGTGKEGGEGKGKSVLSMAQRAMMEKEREGAVQRYREMKEMRRKEKEKTGESDD